MLKNNYTYNKKEALLKAAEKYKPASGEQAGQAKKADMMTTGVIKQQGLQSGGYALENDALLRTTGKYQPAAGLGQAISVDMARAGNAINMPVQQSTANTAGEQSDAGEGKAEWETLIDDIYESSRKSQLEALKGQYTEQTAEYEKQKKDAHKTFDPLRNEAYVNAEMAERSRKEAMANMGLSGAGGMSQTLQQRNVNTLLQTLGRISRKQQDFTDNVNFALGQLATQYDASMNSINAQIESEKGRAYLEQGNWLKSFGLQQD